MWLSGVWDKCAYRARRGPAGGRRARDFRALRLATSHPAQQDARAPIAATPSQRRDAHHCAHHLSSIVNIAHSHTYGSAVYRRAQHDGKRVRARAHPRIRFGVRRGLSLRTATLPGQSLLWNMVSIYRYKLHQIWITNQCPGTQHDHRHFGLSFIRGTLPNRTYPPSYGRLR